MHFWVVSVLQKPGFNADSLLFTKKHWTSLAVYQNMFQCYNYVNIVTKNIHFWGFSVPQKQGFDAGFFLHKWHAFGEASIFRRNDASILRKLPWKEPFNLEVAALFWTCFPYLPGKDPFILHQFAPPSPFFQSFSSSSSSAIPLRHSTAAICLTFANLKPLWGLQGLGTILSLL
jgi:hypothetical protein